MLRQILVVHGAETVLDGINLAINANISDAAVLTAATFPEALETVQMFNIHLILFSPAVAEDDLIEVFHNLQPQNDEPTIPMLLLLDGEDESAYQAAFKAGVAGAVSWPCDTERMCEKIDWVCNPQRLRGAKRYSIPHTEVSLSQPGCSLCGRVVNISVGGLLCQLDEPSGFECLRPSRLTVNFDLDGKRERVEGLEGGTVNLKVVRSHPDGTPAQVRLALRFVEVIPEVRQKLDDIFASFDLEERLLELAQ